MDSQNKLKKTVSQNSTQNTSWKSSSWDMLISWGLASSWSYYLKFIQRKSFASEIEELKKGHPVKLSSNIRKLDPILDDGLIRVGGRLHKPSMPLETKHPIILPKDHHVSNLILRQIHCELKHSGRNHMLSMLRQKYWLIHAPSSIRMLISKCIVCRRQRAGWWGTQYTYVWNRGNSQWQTNNQEFGSSQRPRGFDNDSSFVNKTAAKFIARCVYEIWQLLQTSLEAGSIHGQPLLEPMMKEYLSLLQERQKWHKMNRNLKIGDVVLVVDSNAPRNSWLMGVVLATVPDRFGLVRQVKFKDSNEHFDASDR